MNQIIQSLYSRKSVRVFEPTPVAEDVKQQLLSSAAQAPTAGNQMLYTVIDVTDQALKDKLAVSCDNQAFIATAPLVLVFLADGRRWYNCYLLSGASPRDPGPGDLLLAFADTCIAAQNVVVAAESLGLGSCYIGDILENKEEVQQLLHLPKHCVPACMLVIGYPNRRQLVRKKAPRFPLETFVFENTYRELGYNEFVDHYTKRAQAMQTGVLRPVKPFSEYMQEFCERKYNSDFSREMNRSAAAYLKDFMPQEE